MMSCKCSCGWPVHTTISIEVTCPQCQRIIKCNTPWGLGDWVDHVLSLAGGNIYKRAYQRIFKKKCGCDKRKAWLNRLGSYLLTGKPHSTQKEHGDT